MPLIFFNILLLISFGIETSSENSPLPKCRNYQQACAIELVKFPELALPTTSTTTIPPDQSTSSSPSQFTAQSPSNPPNRIEDGEVHLVGDEEEGSGELVGDHIQFVPIGISSFPMYDEFVPTTPIYDYMAEPVKRTEQQICTCPEEEACNFENANQQISFNHQIRASFCKPLDDVFKVKCKGTRTLARVIGELDRETEDCLSAVNDTLVFCRCHSGQWGRVMVEPWINNAFAFSYKCLNR